MGLYKRGMVWHYRIQVNGQQLRRSTKTEDRKLAQRIYDKVKGQVAEDKWFDRLPGEEKTFKEMMDRYKAEYLPLKSHPEKYESLIRNLLSFFGSYHIKQITPSLISQYKTHRRHVRIALNREFKCPQVYLQPCYQGMAVG